MIIQMPYGENKLKLSLPDSFDILTIEPIFVPALPEPQTAIRESLRDPINSPPLSKRIKPEDRVGIIVSDITRPTPNWLILPEILAEIAHVPRQNIIFLMLSVLTGRTQRKN
jgi:nickel-dependent lactate racemase